MYTEKKNLPMSKQKKKSTKFVLQSGNRIYGKEKSESHQDTPVEILVFLLILVAV